MRQKEHRKNGVLFILFISNPFARNTAAKLTLEGGLHRHSLGQRLLASAVTDKIIEAAAQVNTK